MSKSNPGALPAFVMTPAACGLPPFDMRGRTVLDVGCGNGKDLAHPAYAEAAARWGIDLDERGIEIGRKSFPTIIFVLGKAESLPFPDAQFDVVTCRVALPYTNVGFAIREMARVMKPNGHLSLTLHDWRLHLSFIGEAWQRGAWKRVIDLIYAIAASVCYLVTNRLPRKPWSGGRETFQFVSKTKRQVAKTGFYQIVYQRTLTDQCLLTARRSQNGI